MNRSLPDSRRVCCSLPIMLLPALLALSAWARFATAVVVVTYTEVGASHGIQPAVLEGYAGSGLAAEDFDKDGDIDLFVTTAAGYPDQLYVNQGDGNFVESAATHELAFSNEHRSPLWFDYDGDQDLDLLITNDEPSQLTTYELFRNDPGQPFVDVTQSAGLFLATTNPISLQRGGVCAVDFNRDGYLDLVTTIWGGTNHLFMNNRDGTFSNASVSSGLGILSRYYHQPVAADFNGDDWPDIYISVDFAPNQLWINQQNGTFVDFAGSAGAANSMNDMGVALGDYDNDGDFDIYVTNIYNFDSQSQQQEHNILLKNDTISSIVLFTEVSMEVGVDQGHWGWGTTFLDCDNDGWLDIAATNGWRFGQFTTDPSKLYRNNGVRPIVFEDVSDDTGFNDTFYGSALVAFDMDRDGDLDMAQTTMAVEGGPGSSVRLLENEAIIPPGIGNYLVVQPRMDGPNHWAIGAVCRATTNVQTRHTYMRLITSGTSYLAQEPAEAFFGLGSATSVETLVISWPDGTETTLNHISPNQVLVVSHGGFGDLDANGFIELDDWELFANCFRGPAFVATNPCLPADFNADRRVDLIDAAVFQNRFNRE